MNLYADIVKAKKILQWEPKFQFKDSLKKVINWYREMDNKPLISILMNCYNGEEFLKESLNSVVSQSYKKWELIFWDNQSTDRSIEIASSFKDERIRIFRSYKKAYKSGKARKDAFNKAIGDYLAFLDVDDIWKSNKLIFQIKEFSDKGIGISFTNSIYFSKKIKKLYIKTKVFLILILNL